MPTPVRDFAAIERNRRGRCFACEMPLLATFTRAAGESLFQFNVNCSNLNCRELWMTPVNDLFQRGRFRKDRDEEAFVY